MVTPGANRPPSNAIGLVMLLEWLTIFIVTLPETRDGQPPLSKERRFRSF